MFESTKEDLEDILEAAAEGKLQLPDFQRDYVWGDEDVKSLIASVAKGFPVGALLTLTTGGEVSFKPRPITGVLCDGVEPVELLLDGQQRVTSLFQSLLSDKPVKTHKDKEKAVERFYYLDIEKALNAEADLFDSIVGVPADRVVRSDFGRKVELDVSSQDLEFEASLFPLNRTFDASDWLYAWRDYWKAKGRDLSDLQRELDTSVLKQIRKYEMPIIRLKESNSREAICLVFEKVNVGGKKLDAFELLTAVYAADEFDLRHAWNGPTNPRQPGIRARMIQEDNPRHVLKPIQSTDFLQACTLLHTREIRMAREQLGLTGKELPQITCNRAALLALPLTAFQKYADPVERGFVSAAKFLNDQKFLGEKDIPYPSQVVALAATFAALGDDAKTIPARKKLERWYWSGSLGQLYGSATESRVARDLPDLVAWIREDGPLPKTVDESIFQQERLRSLRGRISAPYKAVTALLLRHECRDFVHGEPTDLMGYFNNDIDVHHIFPRKWCTAKKIPVKVFDSIINKTPLSKESNIRIGGDAPSVYLKKIEEKTGVGSDDLDEILRTHLIDPVALRADNFDAFYQSRMEALSELIGNAMGKAVVADAGTDEPESDLDTDLEDDLESEFALASV